MSLEMHAAHPRSKATATIDPDSEFELADGTRLVPEGEARPARVEGDRDHAFSFADVRREAGEPFRGYRRLGG